MKNLRDDISKIVLDYTIALPTRDDKGNIAGVDIAHTPAIDAIVRYIEDNYEQKEKEIKKQ